MIALLSLPVLHSLFNRDAAVSDNARFRCMNYLNIFQYYITQTISKTMNGFLMLLLAFFPVGI